MLDREQVLHVARLARLELTDDEVDRMADELSKVLDHIEAIRELDLEGVPPTSHVVDVTNVLRADEPTPSLPLEGVPPTSHVVDVTNVLRADEPTPSLPREAILAAAPEPLNDGFGVPSPGAA